MRDTDGPRPSNIEYASLRRFVAPDRSQRLEMECPVSRSPLSGGLGGSLLKVRREEPIGLATMRLLVFLFRTHLRKRLRRTPRLKPGVPSEDRGAARLDEDLTMSLAKEEVRFGAIPVPHATLRFRGT